MRRLEDRTEIATAINFKKYPVIAVDLAKRNEYGIVGTPVLIDNGTFRDGEPFFVEAVLTAYYDERCLCFSSHGCCLKADFGYNDLMRLLEYANAPVVKPGQEILVCVYDSHFGIARYPVILKTGERVDPFCQTPMKLEKYEVLTPDYAPPEEGE